MKAIMISIQPKWCELIASGKKTIEVRKTRPKIDPPFKCYIYCTKNVSPKWFDKKQLGKVIGEFVCDCIRCEREVADGLVDVVLEATSCVNAKDLIAYSGGKALYSWNISDLVIYDKPKELSEFKQCHKCEDYEDCYAHEYSCDGTHNLLRPPQSWCYVDMI